jgi:hypothetical protein
MSKVINIADFKGRYNVARTSYNVNTIDDYIQQYEAFYLAKLLGADLAELFKAGITSDGAPPTDPLFLKLYNPLYFDSECNGLYSSKGMKEYLLGLIYWHYMIEERLKPSITAGALQPANENSEPVESRHELNLRFNDSIRYGQAIQKWCCEHKDDYPDYKGSELLLNWPV